MASYEEELKRIRAKYETQRRMGNNKQNTLIQQQSNPVVAQQNPTEIAVQNTDNLNGWEKFNAGLDRFGRNLAKGVYGAFEGVMDTALTAGANVANWFGADTTDLENFIKTDYATQLAEQRIETGNKKADAFINKILLGHGLPDIIEGVGDMTGNSNIIAENNRKIREYSNSGQALNSFGENLSQGIGSGLGFVALGGILPQNSIAQFGGMFASAGGKSVEESLNEGRTLGQATAYGAMSGAVEARTEAFVGKALSKLGLGTGKIAGVIGKTTSKATDKVGSDIAKRGASQVVKNLLKNFNEEGAEEVVSDLANPIIRMIAYSDYEQDKNWLENYGRIFENNGGFNGLLQSYIYGGLSGSLFEGVQATNIVRKYGFDGYYLSDVAQELGEAEQKLTKAIEKNDEAKIDSLVAEIKEIQEKNKNKFERYASMIQELEQKTGFTLKNYLDENGDLDLSKFNTNSKGEIVLNKNQKKVINKSTYLSSLKSEINAGTVQERMIRQTIDEFNKDREDKINLNFLSQDKFIKAQQDNGVEINLDTVEGLKRANANAYVTDNGDVYINKDSKIYKQGKLFSTIGHEIMHGLEKTGTYYQMFNQVWNNMSKEEQTKVLDEYRKKYKGIADTNLALKKEWFADYIGKNALGNYKQFTKQLKKTNAITRAIMKWRKENTVKSALEERKVNEVKKETNYAVDTETVNKTATKQKLAYQFKDDDEFALTDEELKELNDLIEDVDWISVLEEDLDKTFDEQNKRLKEEIDEYEKEKDERLGKKYDREDLLEFVNAKLSPQVKEFFKNSVVKTNKDYWFDGVKDGKYLVPMFHGTPNADMYFFDSKKIGSHGVVRGYGFNLTSNLAYAQEYAGEDGKVIASFVNITKPMNEVKQTVSKEQVGKFLREFVDKTGDGYLGASGIDAYKEYDKAVDVTLENLFKYNNNDVDLIDEIYINSGMDYDTFFEGVTKYFDFDGILYKNRAEGTIAIAFRSNQIKDLNNKKPTKAPDIRYQLEDSEGDVLTPAMAKWNENNKFVDDEGRILRLYHGSSAGGFMTFNDDTPIFLTPDFEVAWSYGGNSNLVNTKSYKTALELINDFYENYDKNIDYYQDVVKIADDKEAQDYIKWEIEQWKKTAEMKPNTSIIAKMKIKSLERSLTEGYLTTNQDGNFEDVFVDEQDLLGRFTEANQTNKTIDNYYGLAEMIADGEANEVGNTIYALYAKAENPIIIDARGNSWLSVRYNGERLSTDEIARRVKEEGKYDGIIFKNIMDNGKLDYFNDLGLNDVYVVFKNNQVKAIDNENPTQKSDIRYSLSGDFDVEENQRQLRIALNDVENHLIKKDDKTLKRIKEIDEKINNLKDFSELLQIRKEMRMLGKENIEEGTGVKQAKTELTDRLNKVLKDYPELENDEQTRNKLLRDNLTIDSIRKKIDDIKNSTDIIAEELKERRNAKTLKERITLDIEDLISIAEKSRERIAKENTKDLENSIKTVNATLQSSLNKSYRAESTKTYKDFEEAFNGKIEEYKSQLKDLGLTDDEINKRIKPFELNIKDVQDNFEQYEKFKTVVSYKTSKAMLNDIIDVKTLQTDNADKKMTGVIDRINTLFETTIDKNIQSLDTQFENALKSKNAKEIEKIHNKAKTLFEVLNDWLMPVYEEFSDSTEYNQDKYQELKNMTVDFGFAVNDYDVNSDTVKEALKVQEVAEKVEKVVKANNEIVNKTVKPKVDTTKETEVEKITKNLKPKVVEKVVEKTKIIKDVRKKSVDSVDTVKYWTQANADKYFELKAVDEMLNLITEEVKNCGIEFKFLFDKQGGAEIVSDEIHKILNNYRRQYGKTVRERVARIYETLIKGSQMRLPNINGETVWQPITVEDSNSFKIENTVKDIIRKTVNAVLTQGGERTTIAKVVSELTTRSKEAIEKVIKENNKRYERLQKQLDEMQTVINGTATIKAKNVVDSKEVNSLKKQITELRETVERLISQPAELKTDKEMDKYNKTVKDLKNKLSLVQKDYTELKRKAKAEATRVARLKSDAFGKVKVDATFRKHLTSGLKDVFGNTFEIDNDVYKDVADELSKGHIDKATNKFFDYLQSLRIQGEDGEISVSNLDDEEFKAELEQLFVQSYSGLKQSNIEKVKDKLKAKTKEVKDKLRLQKETFKVADQILKKSEAIDNMIKAKGIVRPQIATQVIKLAKMFSNISRTKAFNTDIRNSIFEFYNFLNSTVEGENITVAENLGVSIPEDLTLSIAQLQNTVNALTDKNKVSIDEMKQYKDIINQIKKFIERANPTREIEFKVFNEATGEIETVNKMAYEWAEQSIREQKQYKELLGKQRWGINRVIDPRLVFQRLAGYNKNSIYNMLYEKLQYNQTQYETNIMAMKGIVDKFIKESKENKQFYKSLSKKITVDGITATKGEILSLYKLIRRKQGREHIVNKLGGFMVGSVSYKNVTNEMLDTLKESIEEKFDLNNKNSVGSQYIDMTIDFFEYAKELKKKTDEAMKGYSNVEEGEYFPIRIASLSKQQILDVKNYYDPFSLEGARSYAFNENVKGTAGMLDIGDITSIMQTHMKQIAMYNAYSETFDEFQSLFNLKLSENKKLGIESGDSLGLVTKTRFKTKDNQIYQLDRYLNSLFGDIQGIRSVDTNSTSDIVNKIVGAFRSRFATFQLGANLKVMASQLASIPASMKYIKARYLIPALVPFKTNVDTPEIALYRRDNKSIVNATTLNDEIGKIGSLFTKGIQFTDRLAIDVLWRASLLQTKNSDGSFNKAKAERLFTKALRETQPNYTALDRSELLRSKNEIVKAFVMFTTQPAKNLTNFIEAVSMIHTKKKLKQQVTKADYAYVRNTLTGLTVQALTYSAMGWLFNKMLNGWEEDDDDKQNELFAFIQRFINDNIIGMIPAMNNIQIDFEDGFKVNPYELGSLETLNDIITNASSLVQGGFNWKTLVDTAGMVMGVPTNNMYKYTKGITKLFRLEELEAELESGYKNLKLNNKTLVNEALKVGKTTRAKTYYKKYLNNITDFDMNSTNVLFDLCKEGYNVNTKQIPNTIKIDGEDYGVDIEAVRSIYKGVSPKVNSIISNAKFNRLTKEQQAVLLNKVFASYYNKAMLEQYNSNGDDRTLSKTDIIYTSKISAKNLIYLTQIADIEASGNFTRKEMVTKYISKLNITANEKYLLYMLSGYKISDDNKRRLKLYLRTLGLTSKEIAQLLEEN